LGETTGDDEGEARGITGIEPVTSPRKKKKLLFPSLAEGGLFVIFQ
jgi:hypothetical protein